MKFIINNNELEITMVNDTVRYRDNTKICTLSVSIKDKSFTTEEIADKCRDFSNQTVISIVDDEGNTSTYKGYTGFEINKSATKDNNNINIVFTK